MCREVWGFESLRGHQSLFVVSGSRCLLDAHVAELVDAHGSGPCAARCGGSSPSVGTKTKKAGCASNRPFAFWRPRAGRPCALSRPRARRLRASREGLESLALQGKAGSRNVTELPPWAPKQKRPV